MCVMQSASTDERIQALTCLMGEGSPLLPEDLLGAACWPDLCDTLGTLLTTAHESDALRVSHTAVQLVMQLAHEACATSTPHAAALLVAVLPATVQLLAAPCAEAVAAGWWPSTHTHTHTQRRAHSSRPICYSSMDRHANVCACVCLCVCVCVCVCRCEGSHPGW